jgi:hypothetical protein
LTFENGEIFFSHSGAKRDSYLDVEMIVFPHKEEMIIIRVEEA